VFSVVCYGLASIGRRFGILGFCVLALGGENTGPWIEKVDRYIPMY
jgi:hypothetical protein